jgi:hypothetical protein
MEILEDVLEVEGTITTDLPPPLACPFLVLVSGLPGSGKSTFCRKLREKVPSVIVESDNIRKVLFTSPGYSREESVRLFYVCHEVIRRFLERGIPVIFDATNLEEHHRQKAYHIAHMTGAKLILVEIKAPLDLMKERLTRRSQGMDGEDNSTADVKVLCRMKGRWEEISEPHFVCDTSRDMDPVIRKIQREIRKG